ncbi:MAG TPA: ATP-binding protein, partial [Polyangiales bacterium]
IFEDVTAYRGAEEALRKSEARHRALLRALPDLVVVLDRCGVVLDYHGPNATWLLASTGRCLGRTFHEVLPAEVAREIDVAIAASQATKKVVSVKHKLPAASGVSTYEARVLCAEDDNVYLVIRDVTEQSRMEEQLFISDRMASIGTLAAGVAHEINNPLAALMANLTFAVEDVTKLAQDLHAPGPGTPSPGTGNEGSSQWVAARLQAIDEPLQDARESAERVRHIVRDLKIFSRSDEEKTGAVDVRAVMESSLRMAWNEIRHRARLVKDYAEVPWVEANEGRLGQVFLNLIVNAAQAMPEGRADRNEIRVVTKQDEHGRVVVEIRDTGSGIAESVIPRIFDPFFTTKPIGEGTGLGLSICQRIVTALGGELSVESQLGKGSVFRIILPVAKDQAAQASPTPPAVVAGRRGRILVIDDEPMLGKAVFRMLCRDHEVLTETTARAAIERVSKGERFDLMLCDLMMPELTGMDLHAELLRIAPEQAQKMVFMTGGAFTTHAREFLEEVRNPRIDKPLDVDKVRALVRGLLG